MTKTIDGKTYELVSEVIPANRYSPARTNCNCYECAAIRGKDLCLDLGNECINKGIWKEVST